MGRTSSSRLPQFVDDLVETGSRELVTLLMVDEAAARHAMHRVAEAICSQYARSIMYVPMFNEPKLSARDIEIVRKYEQDGPTGARRYSAQRVEELSIEYQLTNTQIYAVLAAMRRRVSGKPAESKA